MPLIVPLLPPPDYRLELEEENRSQGHRRTLEFLGPDYKELLRQDEAVLLFIMALLKYNNSLTEERKLSITREDIFLSNTV